MALIKTCFCLQLYGTLRSVKPYRFAILVWYWHFEYMQVCLLLLYSWIIGISFHSTYICNHITDIKKWKVKLLSQNKAQVVWHLIVKWWYRRLKKESSCWQYQLTVRHQIAWDEVQIRCWPCPPYFWKFSIHRAGGIVTSSTCVLKIEAEFSNQIYSKNVL